MKYSIILPVRNGGHYIKECVNSILQQSNQDFNVIVLDNCSTDGSKEWLLSLNNDKIIIHTSDKPLSIEENWARILTIEKNEFITIIGHDDILYPNYLSSIDTLINNYPDASLYQTHFNFIDGKGEIIRPCLSMPLTIKPIDFFESILKNSIEIIGTGFMVRSKEYDANGGIPSYPNLLYADIEIWMKIIKDNYLAISPVNSFAFRFHINNTSKSSGMFRLAAFERMILFFNQLQINFPAFNIPVQQNGYKYLKDYVIGSCHKLIYIPKANRNGVTMDKIIATAQKSATLIIPNIPFKPTLFTAIKLAKVIDNVPLLRHVFLFYKSFTKRTF